MIWDDRSKTVDVANALSECVTESRPESRELGSIVES